MDELYKKLINDGILRKHNLRAYMKVVEMFKYKNKVAIDHATGTGKSFISLQLMYDNQDKNILFLVPRDGIGSQIEEHINGLGADAREKYFKSVQIMTTQKFIRLTRNELKNLNVDLLITDEFHHYGSEVWGKRVNDLIESHPNLKVFGMTATPKRNRGSIKEVDMGDAFFEGNIASRYTLADAIAEGVLQAPIYRGAIYKLGEQIDNSIDKVENSSLNNEEKSELLNKLKQAKKSVQNADSFNDILKNHIKPNGKYIVFCPQKNEDMEEVIESSYSWFKNFIEEKKITRYQVKSKNSKRVNKINSDAFYNDKSENKLKLMFAMDMYNEGIHVPDIDGVIMLRPTQSDIIFYQQLGRALAAGDDNKKPLVLDFVNNYDYIRKLESKVKQLRKIKEKNRSDTNDFKEDYNLDIVFDIDIENVDIQNLLFEINNKISLSLDKKIEEYIIMVNNEYTPKSIEKDENKKFSNGDQINKFWNNNKKEIIKTLFTNQKYSVGYEKAKEIINNITFNTEEKISEYIEMVNNEYTPKSKEKDESKKFSNGDQINYFWSTYKKEIIKTLFTNQKYSVGYEKAKEIINNITFNTEEKISEYIEMVNNGYTPKHNEKDESKKFSNGDQINQFWRTNKKEIIKTLFSNQKYGVGYEKAKKIILEKSGFLEDDIELINGGKKL